MEQSHYIRVIATLLEDRDRKWASIFLSKSKTGDDSYSTQRIFVQHTRAEKPLNYSYTHIIYTVLVVRFRRIVWRIKKSRWCTFFFIRYALVRCVLIVPQGRKKSWRCDVCPLDDLHLFLVHCGGGTRHRVVAAIIHTPCEAKYVRSDNYKAQHIISS